MIIKKGTMPSSSPDAVRFAELESELERLHAAFASGTLGFACAAPDGRLLKTNPAFRELVGRPEAELAGVRLLDFVDPDDREGDVDYVARLLAGEIPACELTGRWLRKDGRPVWVRSSLSAVRDDAGEPEYLVAVVQDVTAQRELGEQNARLFGFPLCLIFIAGFDGYFKRVNAGYERLLGWTEQELLAREYTEFVHPDDIGGLGAAIEEVMAGRLAVIDQEIRVLAKDGSYRWLMGSYKPVPERGVMYGVAVDVTERRQLEEALARRSAELETVNRELEAFSYSVSHDLRAPLRAIDGFSRILLETVAPELGPEGQRYLSLITENAQQMGELIDGLLAFSRLGQQALSMRPVSMEKLVREALSQLESEREGRVVAITVGDLPTVRGDPDLLRQVLVNLLSNALKYTRTREQARIEIGTYERDGERVFFVRDDGVGFDMRYADKLFAVFQRLHRAEDYEGTGLGLALVARIVDRHGGRIWAEAKLDQGATFYFTLEEA